MTEQYHNPFANMDLIAPIEHRDFYDWYCQTGGNTTVDQSPFPRMVDFWFSGLSLAAHRQLKPIDLVRQETFKFIEGSIFDRDSWRIQAVMLIAIAVEDDVKIVGEPRRMMTIANGLAASGIPHIVEMLREGNQDPIWNLSDAIDEILREKQL
ncbi:MAG: hypothetical protein OXM61_13210 [Candidatus Poribacteria bacterium]|nr:hypothetical protein [Candidatus Poribacteria bacterium]